MNDSKTIDEFSIPDELLARCVGRVDLVRRVIAMFVSQLDEDLGTLAQLEKQPNKADELAKLAHRLKGAAANVGAKQICEVAANIEQATFSGEFDLVSQQVSKLEAICTTYKTSATTFLEQTD